MGEEEISHFSFIMGVTAGTHKLSDLVTVCKTWKKGGGVGIFHPGCFASLLLERSCQLGSALKIIFSGYLNDF